MRDLIAALLATASFATPASADPWVPLADAHIDGVWRSQGYGHIVTVRAGKTALFHAAGPYCYPDPEPSLAGRDEFRLVRREARDRIAFAITPERTLYRFRRIATLPAACAAVRTWNEAEVAKLIAATFDDLYPGFGVRGRDRQAFRAAILGGKVPESLEALDDGHVGLEIGDDSIESGEAATLRAVHRDARLGETAPLREREWLRRYREGVIALLDGGGHQVANRRILWGRIGTVGYLNIVAMGAFDGDAAPDDFTALDAALDEAIAAFQGLSGVIVDITNNRGGYDAISLRIAGRFADRQRLAFSKRAVGAPGAFQQFHVMPWKGLRYLGPVTLLTSDITVSAGEIFTLAMRAFPNVRHVGSTTRGALSDQLEKPLPNGWTLTLPAEIYRDPLGRVWEGVGIAPQRLSAPFPSHAALVAALAREIQAR